MNKTDSNYASVATPDAQVLPPDEEGQPEGQPMSFLEYLTDPQGSEVAGRVLSIFDNIQNATINNTADQREREVTFRQNILLTWQITNMHGLRKLGDFARD